MDIATREAPMLDRMLKTLRTTLAARRRRRMFRRAVRALQGADDRLLRDMGVERRRIQLAVAGRR